MSHSFNLTAPKWTHMTSFQAADDSWGPIKRCCPFHQKNPLVCRAPPLPSKIHQRLRTKLNLKHWLRRFSDHSANIYRGVKKSEIWPRFFLHKSPLSHLCFEMEQRISNLRHIFEAKTINQFDAVRSTHLCKSQTNLPPPPLKNKPSKIDEILKFQ